MLSFGIRFGQGFDRPGILKVMQAIPMEYDYDFLVIGSNPGGIAAAREASSAGKKVAIVKLRVYSAVEEEGYDEDLDELMELLEVRYAKSSPSVPHSNVSHGGFIHGSSPHVAASHGIIHGSPPHGGHRRESHAGATHSNLSPGNISPSNSPEGYSDEGTHVFSKNRKKRLSHLFKNQSSFFQALPIAKSKRGLKKAKRSRRVRLSRIDMNNELYRRGQEVRKLMRLAALRGDSLEDARFSGWLVHNQHPLLGFNWYKLSERVVDFVMEENYKLVTKLADEGIEVIDGFPVFMSNHALKIFGVDGEEKDVTAEYICAALSPEYILPSEVTGAKEFGITCDDFIRLSESPGRTLIVGSTPEGLECAGILALCRYPVTIVSRSKILKNFDYDMVEKISKDLKERGVHLLEYTTLNSIRLLPPTKDLIVQFTTKDIPKKGEYDTIVFAVGTRTHLEFLSLKDAGLSLEPFTKKFKTNELDETEVPNIFAIGDLAAYRPSGFEISELAGHLLGRRLFHGEDVLMDYTWNPFVMYTPLEYAFVGMSEQIALSRFGDECIDVCQGNFKPHEFMFPHKRSQCHMKVVIFKPKGLVVGIHFLGPEAGEVIQGFGVAMKIGLTVQQLHQMVGVHCTKAQQILKLKEKEKQNKPESRKEEKV